MQTFPKSLITTILYIKIIINKNEAQSKITKTHSYIFPQLWKKQQSDANPKKQISYSSKMPSPNSYNIGTKNWLMFSLPDDYC